MVATTELKTRNKFPWLVVAIYFTSCGSGKLWLGDVVAGGDKADCKRKRRRVKKKSQQQQLFSRQSFEKRIRKEKLTIKLRRKLNTENKNKTFLDQ